MFYNFFVAFFFVKILFLSKNLYFSVKSSCKITIVFALISLFVVFKFICCFVHVFSNILLLVCVCMYVYMYVCRYVCICMYTYVCMYLVGSRTWLLLQWLPPRLPKLHRIHPPTLSRDRKISSQVWRICMYICIYVCMYVNIFIVTHTCAHLPMYLAVLVYAVFVFVGITFLNHMYVRTYLCMYCMYERALCIHSW